MTNDLQRFDHDNFFDLMAKMFSSPMSTDIPDFDNFNHLLKINVEDDKDKYLVTADLPGFDKNDIKLDYNNGILSITAKRNVEKKSDKGNIIRRERTSGSYMRQLRLPDVSDPSKITAKYEQGVLSIDLPKSEKKDNGSITID